VFELPLLSGWLPHLGEISRQFSDANPTIFKWSIQQILQWDQAPDLPCPVYRIHGNRDLVLPPSSKFNGHRIGSGGHVISLTHASQVNEFLLDCLQLHATQTSENSV